MNDNPIIAMGLGTLFQTLILIIFYFLYSEKKENLKLYNSVSTQVNLK